MGTLTPLETKQRVLHIWILRCGLAATLILLTLPTHASTTLNHIRQTHTLRCATIAETPEYSSSDDHGPRTTFDTDFCRAVAIAILGPGARTVITSYPDDVAATAALRAQKVDLIPTLTLDLTHAALDGSSGSTLSFSPPVLYDSVGFVVPVSAKLTQGSQLSGKKICLLASTQIEPALRAWFSQQRLDFLPFPFNEEGEMEAAFVSGNCSALAGDLTRLASTRLNFGPLADNYTLLPDQIAPDPLAAATRSDDPAFSTIVTWTLEVLLNAEAAGITQHSSLLSASTFSDPTSDPTIAILTGQTREIGSRLGLSNDWAAHVISVVGNYGEIFDRDLGSQSHIKLPRAQNRLTIHGGLMFPLPLK